MHRYKLDDDDDDDDTGFGKRATNVKEVDIELGDSTKEKSTKADFKVSASAKPPTAMRYNSVLDASTALGDVDNPLDSLSVKKAFADRDLVSLQENLGFNFYSTPWVPPDVDKAADYRAANVYREGRENLRHVALTNDMELGVGLNLYFQFAISIAKGFVALTILAIPTLFIAYSGSAIPLQQRDIVGFYALTLGNIGYDPDSFSYAEDAMCSNSTSGLAPTANQTCVLLNGVEYTMESVSVIITGMEILQIAAFFLMIAYLHIRVEHIIHMHKDSGVPSITDYAVQVTNIPTDTTVEELVAHFSDLYQLEKVDFMKRKPVEGTGPVDSSQYSNNDIHVGTWVAECTICTRLERSVEYLAQRKALMKQLYYARALMKMVGPNTPHTKGYDEKRHAKYEKEMLKIAAKLDKLNEKIHKDFEPGEEPDDDFTPVWAQEDGTTSVRNKAPKSSKSKKRPFSPSSDAEKGNSLISEKKPTTKNQNQDAEKGNEYGDASEKTTTVAEKPTFRHRTQNLLKDKVVLSGFVCFEYNESFARCLEDYSFYSYYPMRFLYPRKMLFKGRKLHVTRAPEPDEIVWENIEIGPIQKSLARLRTFLLLVLVLIVEYALLAGAAQAHKRYTAFTPPEPLCTRQLPELYAGANYNNDTILSQFELTRAPISKREEFDAECSDVLEDSYFGVYTFNGNFGNPAASYSLSSCNKVCPENGDSEFCPCMPRHPSGDDCMTMECNSNDPTSVCTFFTNADILKCYCSNKLDTILSTDGYVGAFSWLGTYLSSGNPDATSECSDMKYYFTSSTIALYLAIIVTLITNRLITWIVKRNAKAEHHISFDEINRAVSFRIFIGTYLNMAIVVLLAFGNSSTSPKVLADNYLFSGPFPEFDRGWYGMVGFYLVVTFILMNFPHIIKTYYYYFVSNRVKKFKAYKIVK
jgi:hypothetical protein